MAEIKYEIEKELGVISESKKGWNKELNLISWNGREAKYDIRDWSEDHSKMGKGITLSLDEIKVLKNLLNSIDF
ncbi:YdbC family protein [Clostridium perfringens]|nr:YdbC family protein [Clostridium perfringens]